VLNFKYLILLVVVWIMKHLVRGRVRMIRRLRVGIVGIRRVGGGELGDGLMRRRVMSNCFNKVYKDFITCLWEVNR